ncbi:exodeoxyribonuclease VII large subunit [Phenylobacterium kunshanense]|uniref:Exodeoxyribonuclease 7 large subunit n=1 Tax=Phenylobacterium kunshanense TaxID=1445034 RepID=A0A328BBJ6_9CAUL|nr:exodeoxyribonuclease VII large subunit [Phenylobacterium kunshanense]RAK64850.1 exodeoxyribonuclease VII large subunit [Phenylobacterium kunshanense]
MTDVAPTDTDASGNARPYSVSELAFALKRTLEDAYGFVRLRGELSKVTHHSNGHVYLTIKDERAAIDGVVWKGQVRGLSVRPEQGLEVVVTGKITTYPQGSRYQIVIETMEAAGIGALLAQLERLKAKLAAEGLFDTARKQPLPEMPAVVGVVTSPTGAVIRDILHRIRDRWPCRVIVWPVVVQGEAAAAQVSAAIRGFNAMSPEGPIPRPDVLIVARGGGSVEDLWAFNDEGLARTVAEGRIPLISAVGHETDTTLIDFVSDRRAPTPTAAAEMATPVLAELKALVSDLGARMHRCGGRVVEDRRTKVLHADRALRRVPDLVEMAAQRFGVVSGRLGAGLARNAAAHERELVRVASRLSPLLLQRPQAVQKDRLDRLTVRLEPAMRRRLERLSERLDGLSKLYGSVDPDRPLQRGFARVARADGSIVHAGASLASGEPVAITFGDKVTRQAVIDGSGGTPPAPKPVRPKTKSDGPAQGDLF